MESINFIEVNIIAGIGKSNIITGKIEYTSDRGFRKTPFQQVSSQRCSGRKKNKNKLSEPEFLMIKRWAGLGKLPIR